MTLEAESYHDYLLSTHSKDNTVARSTHSLFEIGVGKVHTYHVCCEFSMPHQTLAFFSKQSQSLASLLVYHRHHCRCRTLACHVCSRPHFYFFAQCSSIFLFPHPTVPRVRTNPLPHLTQQEVVQSTMASCRQQVLL